MLLQNLAHYPGSEGSNSATGTGRNTMGDIF
jgi:hypothetical protein